MSDYREQHAGAVYAAIERVSELQAMVAKTMSFCDEVTGAIVASVGNAQVESATSAAAITQAVHEDLSEIIGKTNMITEELERYLHSF